MRQLPLGVQLARRASFESFETGENAQAVARLRDLAASRGSGCHWLYGAAATGKSHLLHALCSASARERTAAYLPLRELAPLGSEALAGWQRAHCLCIDDVDAVIGRRDWELALFALYREADEQRAALVLSARSPATELRFALPDLASRCAGAAQVPLLPLTEAQQAAALRRRAQLRGLELPEETVQYLQRHWPRDMRTQCQLLDSLDDAALQAQRRITVPFIREVLRP